MKRTYDNDSLNDIVKCIEQSNDVFIDKGNQLLVLNIFLLLIDKFSLDEWLSVNNFSKKEYKQYFKNIVKTYNPLLHQVVKLEFKNKVK